MNTIKIDRRQALMIAHRGLSGLEKENTAASFIAAGNHTYFGCECDIHLTKDHKFVVCHDSNLQRVSGDEVVIKEHTLEELLNVKYIDNFDNNKKSYYQILEFEEYLRINKKYDKYCIIEFKVDFTTSEIQEVLDLINKYEYLDKCIFISFIREPLERLRALGDNYVIQLLLLNIADTDFDYCVKYNFGIDVNFHSLNEEIIKKYHSANLKVNAWTVNQEEDANQLIKDGIDFITTNILE